MVLNVNQPKFKSTRIRRDFLFVSLLFLLLFSSVSCVLIVQGAEPKVVHVSSEEALRETAKSAEGGEPVVIVLDKNIDLRDTTLEIHNAEITLQSDKELARNSDVEFFTLFGTTSDVSTITVGTGGTLTLDGIIVTHYDAFGSGVTVTDAGKLIMSDGRISGNTAYNNAPFSGGGVYIFGGSFVMSGGVISDNAVTNYSGSSGGVFIYVGSFVMSGGVISDNSGSGVYINVGSFVMSGGVISDNYGGGVILAASPFVMSGGVISGNTVGGGVRFHGSSCSFNMLGGEILDNTAVYGAGVAISAGSFVMSGGVISNNTARFVSDGYYSTFFGSGGGVFISDSSFVMSGGVISNNNAISGGIYGTGSFGSGGGVFISAGSFVMDGGIISNNTASFDGDTSYVSGSAGSGGGMYISSGSSISLRNCEISGNTASGNGGGVWVTDSTTNLDKLTVDDNTVFSDNSASVAYNRDPTHDTIYDAYVRGSGLIWSTPFMQGYNNYDLSYVLEGDQALDSYSVTVIGSNASSSGRGNYVAGANVRINAGVAYDGSQFRIWETSSEGVVFADANSEVTTFVMPANDINVTANWVESESVLTGIDIAVLPSKTIYTEGESLDLSGMVVTAIYRDGSRKVVTNYTIDPASSSVLDTPGSFDFVVRYTEDGVAVAANFIVTVERVVLVGIEITALPTKLSYMLGDVFDLSGMVVTATYSDGSKKVVTGYTSVPANGALLNTVGLQPISVSYTEGGEPKSAGFSVTVTEASRIVRLAVTTPPTKLTYMPGDELDLSGMIVTAIYSDGRTEDVTNYTTDPLNGTVLDTPGSVSVTVSYAENDVSFEVDVVDSLFVVPEYVWAGLAAFLSCFVAFCVFYVIKRGGKVDRFTGSVKPNLPNLFIRPLASIS